MHTVLHRATLKEREQQLVHLLRFFVVVATTAIGNPLHSDLHKKLCCRPFYTFCLNPCKIKREAIRMRNDQGTTQTKTFRSSCVQNTPPDVVARISEKLCTP